MIPVSPQKAHSKFHSHNTPITLSALKEYKKLIANTISDLEEHLQKMEDRIQSLSEGSIYTPDGAEVQLHRIEEEKDSTEKCLNILADVSARIDGIYLPFHNIVGPSSDTDRGISDISGGLSAEQVTSDVLQHCSNELGNRASWLERHLGDLESQISKFPPQDRGKAEQLSEISKIQVEIQSTKLCLKICNDASRDTALNRINIFDNLTVDEMSNQIIVSTLGDLISTKRPSIGARSQQWLGQMSDASLLQLSKSCSRVPSEKGVLTENEQTKTGTPISDEHISARG